MLPENIPSSIAFGGRYLPPDDKTSTSLVDYEMGGVALLDATQGLLVRNWKCWIDNYEVFVQPEGGAQTFLFSGVDITELSFCFDQNMRWSVAYTQSGVLTLRWYDALVSAHVISVFGEGRNPRMCLDDKRRSQYQKSDMIFAYIRGNSVYYRQQRDRFLIERTLRTNIFPNTRLKNIGMSRNLRLQAELV